MDSDGEDRGKGAKGQREKNSYHAEGAEFAEKIYQAKTLRSLRAWREIINLYQGRVPGQYQHLVNHVNPVQKILSAPRRGKWEPQMNTDGLRWGRQG